MDFMIKEYVDKFGELPHLPRMVSLTDSKVIVLMKKAIQRNKPLTLDEIANAMKNQYDVVK